MGSFIQALIQFNVTCCVSSSIFPGIRSDDSPQFLLAWWEHQNMINSVKHPTHFIYVSTMHILMNIIEMLMLSLLSLH